MQKKDLILDWQKEMYAAVRKAVEESKYDMVNLYLKLENVSKKYLKNGEMKEGDSFRVPLENGITLIQSFYKDYSVLEGISKNGNQMLVKKEDNAKKEYGKLEALTFGLKQNDLGIGPQFPEAFREVLKDMRPGQLFVYGSGAAYICLENGPDHVKLNRLIGRTTCPKWDDIDLSDSINIGFHNDIKIQNFYSEIRNRVTDDIQFRWQVLTSAQEAVQKINAGLNGRVRTFQIGPNTVHAKKGLLSKDIKWYDENGHKIPQEKMLVLLGWYENAPVITEYKREKDDPINAFDDEIVQKQVDKLCAEHLFREAANYMGKYCTANNQELSINLSSYTKTNDKYKAVSFLFKAENEICYIYKVEYDDNDIEKGEIARITKSSIDNFENFCKEKYQENFSLIEKEVRQEILEKYPQYKGEFFDTVINKIVQEHQQEYLKTAPPLEQIISKAREDASLLVKSYINKSSGRYER